jgi:hypothetical protein
MRKHLRTHWVLALAIITGIFYVACGGGDDEEMDVCVSASDCPSGFRCINNECVPPGTDAGTNPDVDAGGGGDMDAGGGGDMDAGGEGDTDAGGATDSGEPMDAPMSGAS